MNKLILEQKINEELENLSEGPLSRFLAKKNIDKLRSFYDDEDNRYNKLRKFPTSSEIKYLRNEIQDDISDKNSVEQSLKRLYDKRISSIDSQWKWNIEATKDKLKQKELAVKAKEERLLYLSKRKPKVVDDNSIMNSMKAAAHILANNEAKKIKKRAKKVAITGAALTGLGGGTYLANKYTSDNDIPEDVENYIEDKLDVNL